MRKHVTDSAINDTALDLSNPTHIRAEMARQGLSFNHLLAYEDPHQGWVDPMDDEETKIAVRRFVGRIWQACLRAERASDSGSGPKPCRCRREGERHDLGRPCGPLDSGSTGDPR